MVSPAPDRPFRGPAARRGFSLIELAVVVGILSIVIAIAVPSSAQLLMQARARATENDLRIFSAAFQAYANEHGDWPAGDGTPGAFPPGMAGFLGETNWQKRTPLGGNYAWDPNSLQQGSRYRAVIVITSSPSNPVTDSREQLLKVDRALDDGDLTAGNFLLGYRESPVFVLEH
jgi:prepilin-type N-terminal cleavage/methylation domain-containing protein